MSNQPPQDLLTAKRVEAFMDRWLNDPAFVEQMQADPGTALRSCGIAPNPAVLAEMRGLNAGMSVEELLPRVSKGMSGN